MLEVVADDLPMVKQRRLARLCADYSGATIRRLVKWWFPELGTALPGAPVSVDALADALVEAVARRGSLDRLERALAIERALRVVLPPLVMTALLVVVQGSKARWLVDAGWRLGVDAATVMVVLAQVGWSVQATLARGRGAVRAGLSAIAFVLVACLGMSLAQRWTPARPDVLLREHRGLADCWTGAFVETNYNKLGMQSVWADVRERDVLVYVAVEVIWDRGFEGDLPREYRGMLYYIGHLKDGRIVRLEFREHTLAPSRMLITWLIGWFEVDVMMLRRDIRVDIKLLERDCAVGAAGS